MASADYSVLDNPLVSQMAFYPQRHWSLAPRGAEDHMVPVGDGITLSCRFFPCSQDSPTILFFYGNGEVGADYDNLAPLYNRLGISFFVADYRGYGRSGGSPAFCAMLADAHKVLECLRSILRAGQHRESVIVMGRSMGRHAAFELAANAPDRLAGVIIESGRPTLGQFIHPLESSTAAALESAYRDKVSSITIPALVIHGEQDTLAPVEQAREMYHALRSPEKRMLTIPGAGHNDLLYLGAQQYFGAVREFVSRVVSGSSGGRDASQG